MSFDSIGFSPKNSSSACLRASIWLLDKCQIRFLENYFNDPSVCGKAREVSPVLFSFSYVNKEI